jgi:hypothetical protein
LNQQPSNEEVGESLCIFHCVYWHHVNLAAVPVAGGVRTERCEKQHCGQKFAPSLLSSFAPEGQEKQCLFSLIRNSKPPGCTEKSLQIAEPEESFESEKMTEFY